MKFYSWFTSERKKYIEVWASRHGTGPAWTAWTADGERRTVLAVRARLLWTADRVGGSRGWVPESELGGLPTCVPELSRRPCSTKRKAMTRLSSGACFPAYTWGALGFYLGQTPRGLQSYFVQYMQASWIFLKTRMCLSPRPVRAGVGLGNRLDYHGRSG